MKQLTIDTSASLCAVAISDCNSGSICSERTLDIGRGHAEVLMGLIEECLEESGLDYKDMGRIAVTVGPGSFTGVRVGMSVAKGLKLALSIPLIAISTLDSCLFFAREKGCEGNVAALLDAKRNQAYCRIDAEEPFIAGYEELAENLAAFNGSICGSGVIPLLEHAPLVNPVVHSETSVPITSIARLGCLTPVSDDPIEPLYLRSADAKVQVSQFSKRVET